MPPSAPKLALPVFFKCELDRRVGGAHADRHVARVGGESGRLREEPPVAGPQPDHREAALVVGRRREALADVRVFRRDRGALQRLTGLVLDDAVDSSNLCGCLLSDAGDE